MSDNNKLDEIISNYHELDKKLEVLTVSLDQHFERDERNLEKIGEALDSIDEELETYGKQLEIHIAGVQEARRYNDLLHEELKVFRKTADLQNKEHEKRLKELEKPAIVIKGMLWSAGALATLLGVFALVRSLL